MASMDEVYRAFLKADAAGDTASAKVLADYIRQQTGALPIEEEPERTIGGYAKEAFKGLIPGAAGLAETAITGAAALLPEEAEQAVRERVSGVVEPIRETFAAAPGYEDTAVRKLSEAVGSTLPFLPLGALGAAGRAAAVGLGVGAGTGEARLRAEEEGATEEERGVATALGIGPGALEALPPIRILRRLGFGDEALQEVAGFIPALRRAAVAGGEEALQETSSQVLQNLIAKGVYAPDEAVFGGVGEAAALGGGAGAIVSAIADLALGRRLRGRGAEEPPAEEPTTTEEPPVQPEAVAPAEEEIKALPAPRTAGYKVDREGNVVPMTEAEAEEGARLSSQFRALGLGEAEAIANRMRDQREKQFLEGSDEALRRAVLEEDAAAAAKDDMRYLRSLPMEQMGLPLEGGEAPPRLLAPATEAPPSLYKPAGEAVADALRVKQEAEGLETDIRPRSRPYKETARELGIKLDRKGDIKPNQFVYEAPETELPAEQMGFDLPGIPMERLAPRDRVLRAMAITEDKKNIPNLRFATQLRPMELQKTIGDLKKEGAIAFNKKANEWELTPAGVENVRSSPKATATRGRRGPRVSVPPQGAGTTSTVGTGESGLGGVSTTPAPTNVGEEPSVTPLETTTAPPVDRMTLIRRAAEQRTARAAIDETIQRRTALRTRAIDAFDADEINEKTYLAVTDELKKPVPNFARVTAMLEGTAKPKREKDVGLKFQQAPSPHPEWATKFERDVAGEVVYSDPDAALLRGHSVLSGQPVYMAVDKKTGNRTLVDIDAFSGTLFAPEQKQRLVEAKKRIVAEDAAKFAQNPDGPFTGATSNVVTSDSVNPNYGKFLSNLMGSMGLGDVRVFLLTPEDARTQRDKYKLYGYYSSAMSAGTDPGEEGSIRPYGENLKDFYISFKPGMSETRTLEVISHELGHLIERVAYNKASPEVKNAIRAEYDQWLKDTKGKQGADLVRALRNRETAEAQASGMTADTKLRDSYWRSFSEWFADNTSKWVTTSEKPVGIVEKFFADVARKLRELVAALTGNRFVPAKAVKKFLDDMGPGSADSWIAERRRTDSVSGKLVDPFDAAARYSMSPAEQQKNDRAFLRGITSIPSKLPKPTSETFQAATDAASNATPAMRRALYSTLTAHDFDRMYGKHTKGFGQLWNELNSEGAFLRKQEDLIMENYQKWEKILSKYSPAERDRIFDTFMATTTTKMQRTTKNGKVVEKFGVEVLDLKDDKRGINWTADKSHPLYQQYQSLVRKDPQLEEVYKGLRLAYLDYALGIENVLKQYLAPTEWQKLISQFNEKRLPVYFPLFRKGDFKLKYVDSNGDTVSLQFETLGQRNRAEAEARRNGATYIMPSRVGTREADAIPPSGFFGKIVGQLTEQKVDPEVITSIVNTYLDLLPAQSTLQFARQRKGTEGYSKDMLDAYANVGSSYARRLTNLTYTPKFRAAQDKITEDLENARSSGALDTNVVDDLLDTVGKQMEFIRDPKLNSLAAKLSYFSFQMYLGANISTAIINLVDIPTITYSRLAGKHGWGKAFNAIQNASTAYFSKKKSKEMQELLQRGLDSGVLREQQLRDIAEFKNVGSKYDRIKAGVERASSWAFAKSDMFNRNVAFMAAYQLSKKTPENVFDQNAFDEAQRAVYDVYGSSFPKAAPPIMGNGFARTALTFKKFALIRINLLLNAYREATKGETPEVRKAARREILAYFGTAYLFAGVQGMPVVGALSVLASVLNGALGDDDEPYNPDFELRDAIGLFNYKGPANYLLGVDFASRTGWTGMLWREDPKRMAEVGPITYAMEQFLGPAYSYANGWFKPNGVIDSFSAGEYQRGFEQLSPKVIGNILKGMRYAEEGAVTASGKPLVDDVDAYNVFMQIFGFRPSDVAEAGDIAGATTRMQREILERRNAIIARAAVARLSGDYEGFQEAVEEAQAFSATFPERAITSETLMGAIQRRQKSIAQSVYGITVDKKLANRIADELGLEE